MSTQLISYLRDTGFDLYNMREWLSGGAPPCQGGGRGFDPRLALSWIKERYRMVSFFYFRALPGLESSMSTLRSGPRRPRSPGPRAPSRALMKKRTIPNRYRFFFEPCQGSKVRCLRSGQHFFLINSVFRNTCVWSYSGWHNISGFVFF